MAESVIKNTNICILNKTISNVSVNTAWGSGYTSATVTADIPQGHSVVGLTFMPGNAYVALPIIDDLTNNVLSFRFFRMTTGTVAGTIYILTKKL